MFLLRKIMYIFVTIFSFIYLSTIFSYASDNTDIKFLSRCVTCHSLSGSSVITMYPKIGGQHYDYMLKQLFEFKKGKNGNRFDPTMLGMLQGISESDLEKLALYYSKQETTSNKFISNDSLFQEGRDIYFYGGRKSEIPACVSCHSNNGMGNELANYPALKWQHKEYLCIQMNKFKTSERSNDLNGIMRDIASKMTKEQIEAVSFYISLMN